ncbi:hypothetical protein [Paenibacillus ehimensis]|uniref:hypothetical protein n=1 Tax=Paenibacillus ehimensis TaxID=79264 RepID=UPI0012693BCD|nr:hypothetical protein [Paenibacillus ehimensis]
MKVLGIDLAVIIIALITAYIGYQFNHRAKKRETFLKELTNSYNEVYFPMFELLTDIIKTEEKIQKFELIDSFVQDYSGKESKIRFIGSSSILEYFYKLKDTYLKYKQESNRVNEHELLEKIRGFYLMIEDEYWNAHDIIYEDYKQFVSDAFNNPFFVIVAGVLRVLYHLSVFLFWISGVVLYFTISHMIIPIEWVPKWWNIYFSVLFLAMTTTIFGLMMMIKEIVMKKNRRESKVLKNIKRKMWNLIRNEK